MQNRTLNQTQTTPKTSDLTQARKEALKKNKTLPEGNFEWLNENSRKFLGAGTVG